MRIATKSSKIDISSEKKLEELAKKFQKKLKFGDIVFFYGEMGVGKTTFIKYLINHYQRENKLKITEVTSPTFNILNEYIINKIKINHYDLYRVKSSEELVDLNLFDESPDLITFIEWPEIIKLKPKKIIELIFKYEDDFKKRYLEIKGISF